ncbi:MAG: PD-(D/E)XK nuclease family protein [Defluviitaleaceae bacterium]|nr:PD-(D/E)XK nuclease family protein [Defluviitaleaceae bacterium]
MREFNTTGTCVKSRHYMVDTSEKIEKIIKLIEREKYFTINRPRQYGKTTSLSLLRRQLSEKYLVLSLSFEGVDKKSYANSAAFIKMLYGRMKQQLQHLNEKSLLLLVEEMKHLEIFDELDEFITTFINACDKEVILMIDECDDGSNNDVFLKFLGVLRKKYLLRTDDLDVTFKSIILAGVHDIKSLKYKIRVDDEEKTNSPWNIAENFNIDMSFDEVEIGSMLVDYLSENSGVQMDIPLIAKKIHYFTNGYPFLVSYLCKMIDEEFEGDDKWQIHHLEQAVNELLLIKTTNFDSLIKNIENHEDLGNLVRLILIEGKDIPYSISGPAMEKGLMYGVLARSNDNKFMIHNRIYEMKIYSYLMDKMRTENVKLLDLQPFAQYINDDGSLNMTLILEKYTQYLKDLYDDKQNDFIENNARLLFSIFIKSIINGTGFMYREPVISDRRRLDVIITYNKFKYIIELKIWNGEVYYKKAQGQLADYLEREQLEVGYMIVHDFRKIQHQRFTDETLTVGDKELKVYFV